jgi:hypothetical protein
MIIKNHTVQFVISGNGEVSIKMLSEVRPFIKIWKKKTLFLNKVTVLFLRPYKPAGR